MSPEKIGTSTHVLDMPSLGEALSRELIAPAIDNIAPAILPAIDYIDSLTPRPVPLEALKFTVVIFYIIFPWADRNVVSKTAT
jgi:hypothetical protein